jgi:copper chaperone CopZ
MQPGSKFTRRGKRKVGIKETKRMDTMDNTNGQLAKTPAASLDIPGMTCASCVARVEKAVRAVPGELYASVNLATERAGVRGTAAHAGAVLAAGLAAGKVNTTNWRRQDA